MTIGVGCELVRRRASITKLNNEVYSHLEVGKFTWGSDNHNNPLFVQLPARVKYTWSVRQQTGLTCTANCVEI